MSVIVIDDVNDNVNVNVLLLLDESKVGFAESNLYHIHKSVFGPVNVLIMLLLV